MNNQVVLNSEKLRSISHASHTAEVTITALAIRERLRGFSDINRTRNTLIRKGEKIVDSDYVAFWSGLQDAGVGKIIYGRNKKPERFEWHYSMKKVAQAALEGKDITAERVVHTKEKPARAPKKVTHLAKATRKVQVTKPVVSLVSRPERILYIPLRKDFNLQVSIPSDLSKDEAEVIASAVRRLSA